MHASRPTQSASQHQHTAGECDDDDDDLSSDSGTESSSVEGVGEKKESLIQKDAMMIDALCNPPRRETVRAGDQTTFSCE